MENQKQKQKSHYNHPEKDEPILDASKWLCQIQRLLDELPAGKQKPQHLHLQALYDSDYWPLDSDENWEAAAIRNVSLPRSKQG